MAIKIEYPKNLYAKYCDGQLGTVVAVETFRTGIDYYVHWHDEAIYRKEPYNQVDIDSGDLTLIFGELPVVKTLYGKKND